MDKPRIISMNLKEETRGSLGFVDQLTELPFKIERVYWLWDVPEQEVRGGHAHKSSQQLIICTNGEIEVSLESQDGKLEEYLLDTPGIGLYIPPLWWGNMVFSNNATMIGLASDQYDESDYIRNKEEF